MSVRFSTPIYGVSCVQCGELLTRGPSDADVCARCERDLRTVER